MCGSRKYPHPSPPPSNSSAPCKVVDSAVFFFSSFFPVISVTYFHLTICINPSMINGLCKNSAVNPCWVRVCTINMTIYDLKKTHFRLLSIACGVNRHNHFLDINHFSWTFLSKGKGCMRLSLCKAPVQKEQHKGQPQHWETSRPQIYQTDFTF